ncbi:MAG: hypothetical protein J0L95_11285 [Candidatus Accumulibacter sp.]|nr:hypothetical protein [Accumulibacter sp.]
MGAPAALHHRPVGVEAVEQKQDRQTGKQHLEPVAQERKGAQLAILLLRFGIAQSVFEELAEQRDDQTVVEGETVVCSRCDRGQIYCAAGCAQAARSSSGCLAPAATEGRSVPAALDAARQTGPGGLGTSATWKSAAPAGH